MSGSLAALALTVVGMTRIPGQPAPGRLHVETQDKTTGRSVPARFYLTDQAGAPHAPPGVIVYDKRVEHHFVASGGFDAELPPGRYRLVVERGAEHRPATVDVDIQAGQTRREVVQIERWIDMNARGWYSGDLHNHRKIDEVPTLMLAEDLNIAPTISQRSGQGSRAAGARTRRGGAARTAHAHSL